jgi:two-component system, NarL family, response regulator YdfI
MSSRNGGGKTRVWIAAASPARRSELERVIQEDSSLLAAGSVSHLSALAQRRAESRSDVALVDVAEHDPQIAATSLALQQTGAAVVVLVDDPGQNWTKQMLRAGVLGILPRNSSSPEIHSAIHAASRGLLLLEPELIREIVMPTFRPAADTDFEIMEELTDREIEVLRMLAEGFSNKEIASRLGISDHTVKFHISSILAKLGASSRTEAVTVGVRKGLILL